MKVNFDKLISLPERPKNLFPWLELRTPKQKNGLVKLNFNEFEGFELEKEYAIVFLGAKKAYKLPNEPVFYQKSEEKKSTLVEGGFVGLLLVGYDEKSYICTLELFGKQIAYWQECLNSCKLGKNRVVEMKLIDHDKNMEEIKGGRYLSSTKFIEGKDWTAREIKEREREIMMKFVEENEENIIKFMDL